MERAGSRAPGASLLQAGPRRARRVFKAQPGRAPLACCAGGNTSTQWTGIADNNAHRLGSRMGPANRVSLLRCDPAPARRIQKHLRCACGIYAATVSGRLCLANHAVVGRLSLGLLASGAFGRCGQHATSGRDPAARNRFGGWTAPESAKSKRVIAAYDSMRWFNRASKTTVRVGCLVYQLQTSAPRQPVAIEVCRQYQSRKP